MSLRWEILTLKDKDIPVNNIVGEYALRGFIHINEPFDLDTNNEYHKMNEDDFDVNKHMRTLGFSEDAAEVS